MDDDRALDDAIAMSCNPLDLDNAENFPFCDNNHQIGGPLVLGGLGLGRRGLERRSSLEHRGL